LRYRDRKTNQLKYFLKTPKADWIIVVFPVHVYVIGLMRVRLTSCFLAIDSKASLTAVN